LKIEDNKDWEEKFPVGFEKYHRCCAAVYIGDIKERDNWTN